MTKNKTYEQFTRETLACTQVHVTEFSEEKLAIVVPFNLPEDNGQLIKERVFDEIGPDDLEVKKC